MAIKLHNQAQGYDQEIDRPSVSYADDNGQHVIEGDELLSVEMADHGGTLGARHSKDFIDQDLRLLLEPA